MLRKLKWQIPGENLAARDNCCQGPVPGRGPAVEKHWPTQRIPPERDGNYDKLESVQPQEETLTLVRPHNSLELTFLLVIYSNL